MRLRHQALVVLSLDELEYRNNFKRTEETTTTVVRTDVTEDAPGTIAIPAPVAPAPSVEVVVPFVGLTTAKFLYIETDAPIFIKINGDVVEFPVTPGTGNLGKVLWDGAFTALTLVNRGTAVANVTYLLAG